MMDGSQSNGGQMTHKLRQFAAELALTSSLDQPFAANEAEMEFILRRSIGVLSHVIGAVERGQAQVQARARSQESNQPDQLD